VKISLESLRDKEFQGSGFSMVGTEIDPAIIGSPLFVMAIRFFNPLRSVRIRGSFDLVLTF